MGRPNAPLYLKLVNIEPYNSSHKAILCRPVLKGSESVPPLLDHDVLSPGDYCVYHQGVLPLVKWYLDLFSLSRLIN